jgi:hypothetical protein
MSKWSYFNAVSVDVVDFPETPQVNFGFNSQGFSLLNRGAAVVQYSFDGTTVHGDLDPSDDSIGRIFDIRTECKIWLKSASGTNIVRVEAWGGYGNS